MPRVSVRNSVRKPIRPRAGTTTSSRTQPVPWLTSASVRPLRSAKSCVTTPRYSSGASTETRSTGSCTLPVDRSASRPSACRRSARSPRAASARSAPRAAARRGPGPPTCPAARSEARAARRCRRARRRAGSRSAAPSPSSPSRPASGDVLMPIVIESDGSSTEITGSGRGSCGSASVSPIITSGMPATAISSPGPASSASTRSSASLTYSSVTLTRSIVPSARHQATCCARRIVPCTTRQSARRPTYGEASRLVTSACSGWPSS